MTDRIDIAASDIAAHAAQLRRAADETRAENPARRVAEIAEEELAVPTVSEELNQAADNLDAEVDSECSRITGAADSRKQMAGLLRVAAKASESDPTWCYRNRFAIDLARQINGMEVSA